MPKLGPISAATSAIEVFPPNIAERQTARWRGLIVETFQVKHREPFEYKFHGNHHLLIAAEQASREDGETRVEGLPRSTLREFSGKLSFIPAGHSFHGWQTPRVLMRSVFLYIDPNSPVLPPGLRFGEAELKPRLFFPDRDLWETALKLKRSVGGTADTLYAEALEAVLAYELLRFNGDTASPHVISKGGLAAWQKKRVGGYIAEHLAEEIPLLTLAEIAGLSPYHFARAFKESFGAPPHRYHMTARIEHAKTLLAKTGFSVTEAGLKTGFSDTSSFSAAFRKIARQSPSQYRRSLE